METFLYHYRAIYLYAYDGDSITVDIDLGMGVWLKYQKLRLFGINTPELRGEEREQGIVSRDFVRSLLKPGDEIILHTIEDKTGKYGRWLAMVEIPSKGDLATLLLDRRLAEPKFY